VGLEEAFSQIANDNEVDCKLIRYPLVVSATSAKDKHPPFFAQPYDFLNYMLMNILNRKEIDCPINAQQKLSVFSQNQIINSLQLIFEDYCEVAKGTYTEEGKIYKTPRPALESKYINLKGYDMTFHQLTKELARFNPMTKAFITDNIRLMNEAERQINL